MTCLKKKYIQKQELNNSILNTIIKDSDKPLTQEMRTHINVYSYLLKAGHSPCTYDNNIQIITDGEERGGDHVQHRV